MSNFKRKTVTVLGATGSVGSATLDILRAQQALNGAESIKIISLTANQNWQQLASLALEFEPEFVALADPKFEDQLRSALKDSRTQIGIGEGALNEAAIRDANWVMAAITGAAGLQSVLTAARRGCVLALANKEALVCSGSLLMNTCSQNGTTLLPVDSEHNAIFQVFDPSQKHRVEKIILTASGGPFRDWSKHDIAKATPKQAIAHPIWSMGPKISVDSATLMNKGLELIEARHLFDLNPHQIEVLVHPQSVIHGLVQYEDGSILAQLGSPDMRIPIAHAWAWPKRIKTTCERLSLAKLARLDFEEPDVTRFPALKLTRAAMSIGGNACNALNAANEIAVASFLQDKLSFGQITDVVQKVMETNVETSVSWSGEPSCFEDVSEIDQTARSIARKYISQL